MNGDCIVNRQTRLLTTGHPKGREENSDGLHIDVMRRSEPDVETDLLRTSFCDLLRRACQLGLSERMRFLPVASSFLRSSLNPKHFASPSSTLSDAGHLLCRHYLLWLCWSYSVRRALLYALPDGRGRRCYHFEGDESRFRCGLLNSR
jgi:hypothetical protein